MGSFNVGCGLSNMSIGAGTEIALFPLLPNYMQGFEKDDNLKVTIPVTSNLVSNDGSYILYRPLSLPIFGAYDDYGGIEDIEEDVNTKSIEDFFKCKIGAFAHIITNDYHCNYSVLDWYKKIDSDSDYLNSLETSLTNFDFKKIHAVNAIGIDTYTHADYKDLEIKVNSADKNNVIVEVSKEGSVIKTASLTSYSIFSDLIDALYSASGYHLLVDADMQKHYKILRNTSAMFADRGIYRAFAKNEIDEYDQNAQLSVKSSDLNENVLKRLNFKFHKKDATIDRYNLIYRFGNEKRYEVHSDGTWSHIYDISNKKSMQTQYNILDFEKQWKKLTGINLDSLDLFGKITKHELAYDLLRDKVMEYGLNKASDLYVDVERQIPSVERQKMIWDMLKHNFDETGSVNFTNYRERDPLYIKDPYNVSNLAMSTFFTEADMDEFIPKPVGDTYIGRENTQIRSKRDPLDGERHGGLEGYFKEWHYFSNLYRVAIHNGTLRTELSDYLSVAHGLFANNRFFMPTVNGYQGGSASNTIRLAIETINTQISEQLRWLDDSIEYADEHVDIENKLLLFTKWITDIGLQIDSSKFKKILNILNN